MATEIIHNNTRYIELSKEEAAYLICAIAKDFGSITPTLNTDSTLVSVENGRSIRFCIAGSRGIGNQLLPEE